MAQLPPSSEPVNDESKQTEINVNQIEGLTVGRNFLSAALSNIAENHETHPFQARHSRSFHHHRSSHFSVLRKFVLTNRSYHQSEISFRLSPNPDELVDKGQNVVISVPNDDEFYVGKQKVEVSQISARIRQLLDNIDFCDRVVFIKGAPNVTFQTLDHIVRQARDANVNRIEFVLDKKKRGGK